MSTIFVQIGRYEALRVVVSNFYDRVLADAALAQFFARVNMGQLRGKQVAFFAAALGGPDPYAGVPMREVHRGRGITMHHFGLFAGHLATTLVESGVPADLVAEIKDAIAPLSTEICGQPPRDVVQ